MNTVVIRVRNAGIVVAASAAIVLGMSPAAHADDTTDPGDVPGYVITVQPDAPTFDDECGTANDKIILPPDQDAYSYNAWKTDHDYDENSLGQVQVATYADNSFAPGIVTYWQYNFTDVPCPVDPTQPVVTPAPSDNTDPVAYDKKTYQLSPDDSRIVLYTDAASIDSALASRS